MALAFTVIWITTMGRSQFETLYMTSLGAHASLIGIAKHRQCALSKYLSCCWLTG